MSTTDLDTLIGWAGQLTEEEKTVRHTVRQFVDKKCMPLIGEDFELGRFRTDLIPDMAQIGLLGANLSGYGCAGISAVGYGLACMELERCDTGLRSFVSVQTSLAMFSISKFGDEAQKSHYLPKMAEGKLIGCFGLTEPGHGSNPGGMATRARRDGAGWRLNGSKLWITNAQIADLAIVWAREVKDDGQLGTIVGFIVDKDTPGFSAQEIHHKVSLRASYTGGLHLDEVYLPESARLPQGMGLQAPLQCLEAARFGVAFGVIGAARDCLERAIAYTLDRQQFEVPLASKQLVQAKLADMATRVVQASVLALHYGRLKDKGQLSTVQVSIFKRDCCRLALECARTARGLLGANGITVEYGVIRHMVNLESTFTYEGTDEIHTLAIGRALTGLAAF